MFQNTGRNSNSFNIDISDWNTSNVQNMEYMFSYAGYNSSTWNVGDLSKWNTSNVIKMNQMFNYAGYNATTWNIGNLNNWNVSQVEDMSSMFNGAGQNASTWNIGDVSNWNISRVTKLNNMFYYVAKNSSVWNIGNLNNWNTSKVTNMASMFNSAGQNATTWNIGNISNWNTSQVTNMSYMFSSIFNLTSLDITNWDTSKVTSAANMFNSMKKLSRIKVGTKVGTNVLSKLPQQNSSNIPGADGKWYSTSTNLGYLPSNIPSNKADTYTAIAPPKPPEVSISLSLSQGSVTSSSIAVIANANVENDTLKGYQFSINGGSWSSLQSSTTKIFTGLNKNTYYTVKAKAVSQTGKSVEKEITVKTSNISVPTYQVSEAGTSKNVTINYPTSKQSNWIYEYSLDGGYQWTTVSGTNTTIRFDKSGTVIARVRDTGNSNNTVTASTLTVTVSQVDSKIYILTGVLVSPGTVSCGTLAELQIGVSISDATPHGVIKVKFPGQTSYTTIGRVDETDNNKNRLKYTGTLLSTSYLCLGDARKEFNYRYEGDDGRIGEKTYYWGTDANNSNKFQYSSKESDLLP